MAKPSCVQAAKYFHFRIKQYRKHSLTISSNLIVNQIFTSRKLSSRNKSKEQAFKNKALLQIDGTTARYGLKNFRSADCRLGLDPFAVHCTVDNGPGSVAKRIGDDDSGWSAAIRRDYGQLNALQMDSGYYLVNLARS